MLDDATILEARNRLKERFGGDGTATRLGGKGTARRKKRAHHKPVGGDDKRLQGMLKRMSLSVIPGIEEVAMFKDDGNMLHFSTPKVQAHPGSSTYVVSGACEDKPADIPHNVLDPRNPELIKDLQGLMQQASAAKAKASAKADARPAVIEEEEEGDVPELVENFEDVSKQ